MKVSIDDSKLVARIRKALADVRNVEERKMFGGLCFMVHNKMCVCARARDDEMMCRVGPEMFDSVLKKKGCRPMIHNGRTMNGFVFISPEAMKTNSQFSFWIKLCLDFNRKAKVMPKKKKKTRSLASLRKTP